METKSDDESDGSDGHHHPQDTHDAFVAGYTEAAKTHPLRADCDDLECDVCSFRDCPGKDYFHYHHDGCPSCCSRKKTSWCMSLVDLSLVKWDKKELEPIFITLVNNNQFYKDICLVKISQVPWFMEQVSKAFPGTINPEAVLPRTGTSTLHEVFPELGPRFALIERGSTPEPHYRIRLPVDAEIDYESVYNNVHTALQRALG